MSSPLSLRRRIMNIINNMLKLKQILTCPIFKFKINYSFLKPWRWDWSKIKEFLKVFLIASLVIFTLILIVDILKTDFFASDTGDEETAYMISDAVIQHLDENYFTPYDDISNCNVMSIQLYGQLITYISNDALDESGNTTQDWVSTEDIVGQINGAQNDPLIKAIILEIDSFGGYPVAAEEVANALINADKPTVALIRQSGISAAYWSSTGADIIFASALSDVGSIGVTTSYLDNSKKNQTEGLTFNKLSTGKYKDAGNPDKPLTIEERALFMRDLNIINENFIKQVAANRNLPEDKVRAMADGSSILGEAALQAGLIDRIGGFPEVKKYLEEKIGEKINVCGY